MNKTITEKELDSLFEDGKLCEYCPFVRDREEHASSPETLCEGCYCDDAKDAFIVETETEIVP